MSRQESAQFRATAGAHQGFGATPQEALNSLLSRLSDDALTPIVIWPYNRGDAYFTDAQQARLHELKGKSEALSEAERGELEGLVEAAFLAAISRAKAVPAVKA